MAPKDRGHGVRLEKPRADLAGSYRGLVSEFLEREEDLVPFTLGFDNADFDAFLAHLDDCSSGEAVPEGFVPHTTFWLVLGGVDVVAVSNLRHHLTPKLRIEGGHIGYGVRPSARRRGYAKTMLHLTLLEAKRMGILRALLTCDKSNTASARTIVSNGGRLESEEPLTPGGEPLQRYWIEITEGSVLRQ